MREKENKPEVFDPSKVSIWILDAAFKFKDDVGGLIEYVQAMDGSLVLSRPQARQAIQYAIQEIELDQVARAPQTKDVLIQRIDTALSDRIEEIMGKIDGLRAKAQKEAVEFADLKGIAEANDEIRSLNRELLNIKKSLTEEKRATVAADMGGIGVNINLGGVVTDVLNNIRALEKSKEIDAKEVDIDQHGAIKARTSIN